MRCFLFTLANILGGVVLVLLILDPTRPPGPIFVLLAAYVACIALANLGRWTSRVRRCEGGVPRARRHKTVKLLFRSSVDVPRAPNATA